MRRRNDAGFTLTEVLVATMVFVTGTAIAVGFTTARLPSIHADSQTSRVVALLRKGRELAISTRRDHEVRFDPEANTVTLVRMNTGLETPIQTVMFEYGVRLMQYPSIGSDTPEQYGASGIVNFGDSSRLIFEADGAFIDELGLPINGTILLGIEGQLQAARAITMTGTTARPRVYSWNAAGGGSWQVR